MQNRFLVTAIALVCLCLAGPASAATLTWTGDFDPNMATMYNWSPRAVPTSADSLELLVGSYYQPAVALPSNVTLDAQYVNVPTGVLMTVTSGRLRMAGNGSSEGLWVRNGSLTTDGVVVNGGTVSAGNKNILVGKGTGEMGRMTINGGLVTAGNITAGYQHDAPVSDITGLINVWGGTMDCGTGVRVDQTIMTAKACSGKIDIRGSGLMVIDQSTFNTMSAINDLINTGRIVSEVGYGPVATVVEHVDGDANTPDVNQIRITAARAYKATTPSPYGVLAARTGQVLSWVKPVPRNEGDTVTSNVYIGTGTSTAAPLTLVTPGPGAASSVTVNTLPENRYYWRVDSIDPAGGTPITTTGDVWMFDTRVFPTVTVGTADSRQAAFQNGPTDPNATIVLAATASDDGFPGVMSYQWSVDAITGDPNAYPVYDPNPQALNPTVRFTKPNTYTVHLNVGDSMHTTTKDMTVKVFAYQDYCTAAKWFPSYNNLAGDLTAGGDCQVDYTDLATFVSQWLVCNSLDCQ